MSLPERTYLVAAHQVKTQNRPATLVIEWMASRCKSGPRSCLGAIKAI